MCLRPLWEVVWDTGTHFFFYCMSSIHPGPHIKDHPLNLHPLTCYRFTRSRSIFLHLLVSTRWCVCDPISTLITIHHIMFDTFLTLIKIFLCLGPYLSLAHADTHTHTHTHTHTLSSHTSVNSGVITFVIIYIYSQEVRFDRRTHFIARMLSPGLNTTIHSTFVSNYDRAQSEPKTLPRDIWFNGFTLVPLGWGSSKGCVSTQCKRIWVMSTDVTMVWFYNV